MRNLSEENMNKLQQAATLIIEAVGDDKNREGLKETPKRFAKMLNEVLEGMQYTNDEIAEMYDKCFEDLETGDMVTMIGIPIFSFCEHHIALMYDMKVSIGYLPNKKVIGLSKMARIAELAGKRLQLQEKIGSDIAYIMKKILETEDVIVVIEGKHACMTSRGVKKDAITKTACLSGAFKTNSALRKEFYDLLK